MMEMETASRGESEGEGERGETSFQARMTFVCEFIAISQ